MPVKPISSVAEAVDAIDRADSLIGLRKVSVEIDDAFDKQTLRITSREWPTINSALRDKFATLNLNLQQP